MKQARLTYYPEHVRFCLFADGHRLVGGLWETETDEKWESFKEFLASLERNGFDIGVTDASSSLSLLDDA